MATEQEDRQKYLPSSRALHNRHFPSSKVVLGLISAVPTPLNVYFNISSMWQAKMKEVCSSQRRKAQDWSGELLKFWVKTRSFLWCGQSLCCTFHHCSHVLHLPWQGLSLGLGRTRTMSVSYSLWASAEAATEGSELNHSTKHCAGPQPSRLQKQIKPGWWNFAVGQDVNICRTTVLYQACVFIFYSSGCLSQALLPQALGSLWQLLKGWSCTVAKYSSCSSCSDWTFFLEPQPLG